MFGLNLLLGHCGAILADMPLQCHMEVWDNTYGVADYGGGSHF